MMTVQIKQADSRHLPEILGILNWAILSTTAIYDYATRSEAEHLRWYQEKKSEGFPLLVAELDGKVVGFASYHTFKPKIGYRFTAEHSVYVKDGMQGKGIGSQLMEGLIRAARENGLHTLVGYVDSDNTDSIAFHEKFGFRSVGLLEEVGYKFDRWLDVRLLQLQL